MLRCEYANNSKQAIMQSSQSDILSQCLTLIERGQITPAQCVARYPEFKNLAELLDATLAVRALPLVRLDSAAPDSLIHPRKYPLGWRLLP